MFKIAYFKPMVLLLLFAMAGLRVFAAPEIDSTFRDYVITTNGDTIKGKVLSLHAASVKIDPLTDAHPIVYNYGQVKEVCRNGISYGPVVSMIGYHKHLFAERVQKGAINLFKYTIHQRYGKLVSYYAGKANALPVEVKTNGDWPRGFRSKETRKNNLLALIADDDQLTRELNAKLDYSFDELTDLVIRYNSRHSKN